MSIIMPRANMMSVIRRLGLTQGLKLCLDAGDGASYSGSGQTWNDVSGNGHPFYRGATSGSESSDPTFSGTAGRSSAGEYFEFDGDDYFTLASGSNPTWVNNMHKAGAKGSFVAAVYMTSTHSVDTPIISTGCLDLSKIGFGFLVGNNKILSFQVCKGAGPSTAFNQSSALLLVTGWNFVAVSIDEANNICHFNVNGASSSYAGAYISPSSSNASTSAKLGWDGAHSFIAPNGTRIANLSAWEGRAMNTGELQALSLAVRGKF